MKEHNQRSEPSSQKMTDQEVIRRINRVFEVYGNPRYLLEQEFETHFANKENLTEEEILYLWSRAVDLDYLRIGVTSLAEEERRRLRRIGKLDQQIKELHNEGYTNPTTYSVVVYERTTPEEMAEEREFEEENLREHQEEWMRKQERNIGT